MNIGNITLKNNTVLAPLAGITNLPFRLLAKEAGCGLVCSEMISANGLIHRSKKTLQLMDSALLDAIELFPRRIKQEKLSARIGKVSRAEIGNEIGFWKKKKVRCATLAGTG